MAATPPTYEPTTIRAGDTAAWTRTLGDYPAGAWTLAYTLNGPANITITATADGTNHAVSVPAATTRAYATGMYMWTARVTDGTDTYTVGTGSIEVLVDPSNVGTIDARTHVRTVLDAIEAVLEGRASHDVASYTIGGRQLNRMPIGDLLAWRDRYRAELRSADAAERVGKGLGRRATVRVRNLGMR